MSAAPESVSQQELLAIWFFGRGLYGSPRALGNDETAEEFYRLSADQQDYWRRIAAYAEEMYREREIAQGPMVPYAEHQRLIREAKADSAAAREIAELERAIVNLVVMIGRAPEPGGTKTIPHLGKVR